MYYHHVNFDVYLIDIVQVKTCQMAIQPAGPTHIITNRDFHPSQKYNFHFDLSDNAVSETPPPPRKKGVGVGEGRGRNCKVTGTGKNG